MFDQLSLCIPTVLIKSQNTTKIFFKNRFIKTFIHASLHPFSQFFRRYPLIAIKINLLNLYPFPFTNLKCDRNDISFRSRICINLYTSQIISFLLVKSKNCLFTSPTETLVIDLARPQCNCFLDFAKLNFFITNNIYSAFNLRTLLNIKYHIQSTTFSSFYIDKDIREETSIFVKILNIFG